GIYKLSNALTNALTDDNNLIRKEIQSVFGLVNLSWQDKVFLDLTARNDWSSKLPSDNRSYFCPSVSSTFVLSELMPLPEAFSFAKLRLAWAQVGNDANSSQTLKYYASSVFPGSAEAPSVLHNASLKPEISTSTETGLNIAFLNNRIVADVN